MRTVLANSTRLELVQVLEKGSSHYEVVLKRTQRVIADGLSPAAMESTFAALVAKSEK